MQEETIFTDPKATITTQRVVIGGMTYPIGTITSVGAQPGPRGVLGAVAAILLLSGGAFFLIGAMTFLYVTLPLLVLSGIWFAVAKPPQAIRIGVAGTERTVMTSGDAAWVAQVVAAIQGAIMRRG
jgi:uncharacterized membrane protein YphA (DoxX/SURF4 family)